MPVHLTAEQRQLALRLKARGLSLREIGPQVGCSHELVRIIARQAARRPVRQDRWVPGPGRLRLADREEITLGLRAGESFTVIAARLGKAVSTVSREVAASGGRGQYRAGRAHQRVRYQARRLKDCKLADPALAAQVTCWLTDWWSPVQISRRLRIEFPGDPMMWVSHETIYQALYVQGRAELRDWHPVYFCDPHKPLAAGIEREHQWPAPPVPAQRHPPVGPLQRRHRPHRAQP